MYSSVHSFLQLFIHSLIQQIFIDPLYQAPDILVNSININKLYICLWGINYTQDNLQVDVSCIIIRAIE